MDIDMKCDTSSDWGIFLASYYAGAVGQVVLRGSRNQHLAIL